MVFSVSIRHKHDTDSHHHIWYKPQVEASPRMFHRMTQPCCCSGCMELYVTVTEQFLDPHTMCNLLDPTSTTRLFKMSYCNKYKHFSKNRYQNLKIIVLLNKRGMYFMNYKCSVFLETPKFEKKFKTNASDVSSLIQQSKIKCPKIKTKKET